MGTIGWYGPLINLSEAPSHIGHYVQLLVFIHKSTPVQYKVSKGTGRGGEVIRMDIQVGDETRSYFPVTVWQKLMHSTVVAGEIILLQNIKVLRFKDVIEARTLHCSSLVRLVRLHEMSKGADDLIGDRYVGITTKNKLQRVIGWVQQAGLIRCTNDLNRVFLHQLHLSPYIAISFLEIWNDAILETVISDLLKSKRREGDC